MFANTQMAGQDLAFPDECWTPVPPPGAPQLIPYPNMAVPMIAAGFCPKVILVGAPAHTLSTTIPMSTGDELGTMGGKKSKVFMNRSRHTTHSAKVVWGGSPATRSLARTSQNRDNADGMRVKPSQFKVKLTA